MEQDGFRFILDSHLGKLARYFRLCGFDATFYTDIDDREIIRLSLAEERIIVTRDKLLANSKKVAQSILIKSQLTEEQLKEVLVRYNLTENIVPFSRCMECNSPLEDVEKDSIAHRLEPRTREYYSRFRICPSCDHIFWEGSHFEKMKRFVDNIIENNKSKY